jgi:hypothetical protein
VGAYYHRKYSVGCVPQYLGRRFRRHLTRA